MTDRRNDTDRRTRDKGLRARTASKVAGQIDENPLALVGVGLAIGAVAGALLPRTEREAELLGPTGRRINETASNAVKAAKTAGLEKLDELGVTGDNAKEQATSLLKSVASAAAEASTAASKSVKRDA